MIIHINPENPQPRLISRAVSVLREGGIIAYPTDTYYGIGCDLTNKKAIESVYRLKNRDKREPFSFICSDLKNISDYAKVTNYAYKTMKRLLPGAYTFILEGSRQVPKIMLAKRKTVGIRVPNHKICIELVKSLDNPIISTSAATPDGEVFNDPSFIQDYFKNAVDLVIDGGPVPGEPSSVISLIGDQPEILRQGLGSLEEI
jgi:tRNA threonylcarbamoyl adenosine modification protein (Sua5/YciO/YrdC/YwlC family)